MPVGNRGNKTEFSRGCHACMLPESTFNYGQEYCRKTCSPIETLPRLIRFYLCFCSIRMKDTEAKVREGFEWLRVWAFKESDWRDEIQNPFSMFSDFPFILVCKNTGGVCARGGTSLLLSMYVLRLTCEHEIPEKRELVDDNHRHWET